MMVRAGALGIGIFMMAGGAAVALDPVNSTGAGHLAIRGVDTTGYFRKGEPTSGEARYVVTWKGATWRFGSAKDADLFRANPAAYAPQFGAYCTGGLAQQHVVEGKPQNWRIHDGKLYLFYSSGGAARFSKDPEGTIAKAQAYWNTLGVKE